MVPYLTVEKEGELRDSVACARLAFLTQVQQLRPHVVIDLRTSTFPEYVSAVAECFRSELIDNQQSFDTPALLCLAKQVVQGIEAQHQPSWWRELDDSTREAIALRRPTWVIDHLKGKLSEPLLVELAGLPLMRVIARIMKVKEREIATALGNWRTLLNLPRGEELSNALSQWSIRWNLNAEWCRDHALRVLRQWLCDDPLRWTFLYGDHEPMMRNSRLALHWLYAARHEVSVGWSQAILSAEIFPGRQKQFSFNWRKLEFTAPNFNPIIQTAATWKRETELNFRIDLYQNELNRLNQIKAQQDQTAQLETEFTGALVSFKKKIEAHVHEAMQKLKKAEAKHGLLKVRVKRREEKHVYWAVSYQIPKTSQDCELQSEIADKAGVSEAAVSKAVTGTLQEIGLAIRPKTPKSDLASRIARQLNQ